MNIPYCNLHWTWHILLISNEPDFILHSVCRIRTISSRQTKSKHFIITLFLHIIYNNIIFTLHYYLFTFSKVKFKLIFEKKRHNVNYSAEQPKNIFQQVQTCKLFTIAAVSLSKKPFDSSSSKWKNGKGNRRVRSRDMIIQMH